MSETTDLAELEAAMAAAVAAEDFEAAAVLRDRIGLIRGSNPSPVSYLKRQEPGKMGLGTDQPSYVPPKGWVPPTKPSPMTAGHSKGGRRTKG
ncbi:UvrB/UvrC motif-containing protein [Caulobacter sp.]|uniref:UvrB/UvrC motif-containing protein n=1 Tax=Caulobacter sp. TaxID=78 RepID=UPI003BAE95DE